MSSNQGFGVLLSAGGVIQLLDKPTGASWLSRPMPIALFVMQLTSGNEL
jgi:hypothetical protein